MRAAAITEYQRPLVVDEYRDPVAGEGAVVLRVEATGICRSDWHAWMGHEPLPSLPHVPGHEMAGVIEAIGPGVSRWSIGDRVTVPFSVGCGSCVSCSAGHLNTCDRSFTPGFTHWGSFAEKVRIEHADLNLVGLPDGMSPVHAAALGCRFITAFRAVVDRGRLAEGDWLAVYGCGGVGLSAVMIAKAIGGRVVAIDIDGASRTMATSLGADVVADGLSDDVVAQVVDVTGGGASVAIDAVGTTATTLNSIASLRKHGRHVQVGLLLAEDAAPPIPFEPVIMGEIEILGSRGMSATDYPRVFGLIDSGDVDLAQLVTGTVDLDSASSVVETMGVFAGVGVTVIDLGR